MLTNAIRHQWSSGRIVPCHGTDPGSIPGWSGIAQLGERQTEDLKVACSIHAHRNYSTFFPSSSYFLFGPFSSLIFANHTACLKSYQLCIQ
ncbi:hypothetical protein MTR_4g078300 [Medicago truncatula]|uniref:Uncharacterized protein n=1 Tax=Medicago truncatula TaxID=3880 RepID=G7JTT2_MEDTR|nr:hypothetical protein MTR_4g078300 [Medicago truncatula]